MKLEDNVTRNFQILYTSTNGGIVFPQITEKEMSNKIIGNVYHDGVGRILFRDEVTSIPSTMFLGCDNLKSIVIPPSCRVIHDHAFLKCVNLESVKLNEGLRVVKDYAFSDTGIKKIEIPSSCFIIASYAFEGSPIKSLKLKTPSAAYRYIGAYALGRDVKVYGISKYDDFSPTSFG